MRKVNALKEEIKNRYGQVAALDFNSKLESKKKMQQGLSLKFSEIYKTELAKAKEKQMNSHRLTIPEKETKIEAVVSGGDSSTQPVSSR